MGMKSPYPFFGGKSRVADVVWAALGDVDLYVEPFFGSLAVLLARPYYDCEKHHEIVNDIDGFLVNFWRAIAHDPDAVAYYADYPVTEYDLTARHLWLVNQKHELVEKLLVDPDYYDPKIAGWWVWGQSAWIGSGFCSGKGPWHIVNGKLVRNNNGEDEGVNTKPPRLSRKGQGIHASAYRDESGVNIKRPHVAHMGRGIHATAYRDESGVSIKRPHISRTGQGIHATTYRNTELVDNVMPRSQKLLDYFRALSQRVHYVVIVCGDWKRVLTKGALCYGKTVGIFLDPPYASQERDADIYNHDDLSIAKEVEAWCKENQDNPRYRIALCGYEGDYDLPGWTVYAWKACRAYGTSKSKESANAENRFKERIWFSPNCLNPNLLLTEKLL